MSPEKLPKVLLFDIGGVCVCLRVFHWSALWWRIHWEHVISNWAYQRRITCNYEECWIPYLPLRFANPPLTLPILRWFLHFRLYSITNGIIQYRRAISISPSQKEHQQAHGRSLNGERYPSMRTTTGNSKWTWNGRISGKSTTEKYIHWGESNQ